MEELTQEEIAALRDRCVHHQTRGGTQHRLSGENCWCLGLARALAMAEKWGKARKLLERIKPQLFWLSHNDFGFGGEIVKEHRDLLDKVTALLAEITDA